MYTPSDSHFDQSSPSGTEVLTGSLSAIGGKHNMKDIQTFAVYTCSHLQSEHQTCMSIASISSMKIIEGAFSRASRNTFPTIQGPSPRYFCTNSDPTTRMKAAEGIKNEEGGNQHYT